MSSLYHRRTIRDVVNYFDYALNIWTKLYRKYNVGQIEYKNAIFFLNTFKILITLNYLELNVSRDAYLMSPKSKCSSGLNQTNYL